MPLRYWFSAVEEPKERQMDENRTAHKCHSHFNMTKTAWIRASSNVHSVVLIVLGVAIVRHFVEAHNL